MTLDGRVLSLNDQFFVLDLGFVLLSTFVLEKFSDHTSESDKDSMLLRDSHDKAETFEVEDHFKGLFVLLKDSG